MDAVWSLVAQSQPSPFFLFVDKLARAPLSSVLIFAAVCTAVRLVTYPIIRSTPLHKQTGGFKVAKLFNELADALVYAGIVVFMLVRPFGIQTFYIPTGSMIDTLLINDMIVANKLVYRYSEPQINDIVVFKPPKRALNPGQSETDFIKRLVGREGDVVEVRNKILYRNGKAIDEPYVDYTTGFNGNIVLPKSEWGSAYIPDYKLVNDNGKYIPLQINGEMVNAVKGQSAAEYLVNSQEEMDRLRALPAAAIPKGYFLFVGDNRNGSSDGRTWGLVPRESIIGRSEFVWFPPKRWKVSR